jgi:hypothetical protein
MSGGSSGLTAVGVRVTPNGAERLSLSRWRGATGVARCVTTAFKTSKLGQPELVTS